MSSLVHTTADGAVSAAPVASAASGLSPQARQALTHLADVTLPPPVSWHPQTVGWAVLAVVLIALLLGLAWYAVRRWRSNRYRRAALAELDRLEELLPDATRRAQALAAMPPLLKRCALAAWPRESTAALSGPAWTRFMAAHARGPLDPALVRLLDDLEYHPPTDLHAVSDQEARAALRAARDWVARHRVAHKGTHVPA